MKVPEYTSQHRRTLVPNFSVRLESGWTPRPNALVILSRASKLLERRDLRLTYRGFLKDCGSSDRSLLILGRRRPLPMCGITDGE